jgi:glutamine synthetase adenylyltransferase
VAGALTYYETVGQNWERAAFIKARIAAGDVRAGAAFLSELKPFLWRRSLDYGAIADIHSIKRQILAGRARAPSRRRARTSNWDAAASVRSSSSCRPSS